LFVSHVSLQHEAPLTVLRRSPGFVRELVALLEHAPVALGESVIVDADLTKLTPTARHADLVSVIKGPGDHVQHVIVIEVQRESDQRKPEAWLSYVAHLTEKYAAPVTLLVVAFDPMVAQWARRPHKVGPCVSIKPLGVQAKQAGGRRAERGLLLAPGAVGIIDLVALARLEGVLHAHDLPIAQALPALGAAPDFASKKRSVTPPLSSTIFAPRPLASPKYRTKLAPATPHPSRP